VVVRKAALAPPRGQMAEDAALLVRTSSPVSTWHAGLVHKRGSVTSTYSANLEVVVVVRLWCVMILHY
jgi:hypothetical protein